MMASATKYEHAHANTRNDPMIQCEEGAPDVEEVSRLPTVPRRACIVLGAVGMVLVVAVAAVMLSGDSGGVVTDIGRRMAMSPSNKSGDACTNSIGRLFKAGWKVSFYDENGEDETTDGVDNFEEGVADAYKKFMETDTFKIVIEKDQGKSCQKGSKNVVWLYPTTVADEKGAFGMGDGECERMGFFVEHDLAECVQIYRVKSPQQAKSMLETYHSDHSIVHAVIGGHGSDQLNVGILDWSDQQLKAGDPDVIDFLNTLKQKLAVEDTTVFVDSCFAGVNGVAKQVSTTIPDTWVFGGVVSLTSVIKVLPNTVEGEEGSQGPRGPPRLVSEYAMDKVINPSQTPKNAAALPVGFYRGERLLVFKAGESQGSVAQWRLPSKNHKIFRAGSKVTTTSPIKAYRVLGEVYDQSREPIEGSFGFINELPAQLHGRVLYVDVDGEVPVTGATLILWQLPEIYGARTGGAGASLGAYFVRADDLNSLVIDA